MGTEKTAATVHYLKKVGTNVVFIRTPELAKRADMVAISEEERDECIKRQAEDGRKRSAPAPVEQKPEPQKEDEMTDAYIDSLNEAAARALAEKMKIAVKGNWGVKAIRNNIKGAVAEARKAGVRTPEITQDPKAKALMERIAKVDAADETGIKQMVEDLKISVPAEATIDDLRVLVKTQIMEDESAA